MVEPSPVGALLRRWRSARGKSQLALANEAGVSSRHLSFVETGRAAPSRDMVILLAEALDVPLRERNALLEAAGFAAIYKETPIDAPRMTEVHGALTEILRAHGTNPTLVVNRRYDVLMANDAAQRLIGAFAGAGLADPRIARNVARMLLAPDGLRPSVRNWVEVAAHVVHRLRRELAASPSRDAEDEALLRDVFAVPDIERVSHHAPDASRTLEILVPVILQRGGLRLELFTTITTLGTPLDITLQELRIETLFPATAASRRTLDTLVTPQPNLTYS